jgi:hypothetical protein
MVSDKKFPIVKSRYLKVAVLTAFATLPLLLGISGQGSAKPPSPVPWTGPVPKAVCGLNDRVETGLQGHTTLAQRQSGFSELGYNCNLELVGQYQGEGTWWFGGGNVTSFDDCAYYSTRGSTFQQRLGAVVVDASDPRNPHPTAHLNDTPTMLNSHESLKTHQKRKLLAAVQNGQYVSDSVAPPLAPGFAIYDLSADCRHPVLKASIELPGTNGHAGQFTPDGMTYYATNPFQGQNDPAYRNRIQAIDVSDPSNPVHLLNWQFPGSATAGEVAGIPHDTSFNKDGTRLYSPQPGRHDGHGVWAAGRPNGLVISDVSDIQFRRPNPQIRVISTLFWEDGGTAQSTLPVTIKGRPHLIFADEAAGPSGPEGGRLTACAVGLPPSGFARIIDISDEKNPKLVSKLMLEAHDPANCPELLTTPGTNRQSDYSAHYCTPDKAENPKLLACSYFAAGIRVFDIRDPFHPKEIAYYKPPARRTAFLPASSIWAPASPDRTVDFAPSDIRWRKHKGETHLWFTTSDNGFQIVRFTKSMHELLGKGKGKGKDDDDDD